MGSARLARVGKLLRCEHIMKMYLEQDMNVVVLAIHANCLAVAGPGEHCYGLGDGWQICHHCPCTDLRISSRMEPIYGIDRHS